MKSDPVDTFLVTLNDVLDLDLSASEYLIGPTALFLHTFLLQACEIPYSDGLIKRCRGKEGILWVERRWHDIVGVPSQDRNHATILPIPYSNRLIIWAWTDPREFLVEFNRSNVV